MPHIRIITASLNTKAEAMEAIGVTAGSNPGSLVDVRIVVPVIHPKSAKLMERNVFTATRKDILASFVTSNNVESLLDQT